jgi:hypothetical protein
MDIPNLSQVQVNNRIPPTPVSPKPVLLIIFLAVLSGFIFSRFSGSADNNQQINKIGNNQPHLSTDSISSTDQLKVGQLYGDQNSVFKDNAIGNIQKGGINGVGTHTLARDGGPTQNASLTSSTVDLDLFVGKKVEVKGETNAAAKTGWLMDVGSIKIMQ